MHAGTKPQVLGVLLIMVGGAIRLRGWSATWMLLLVAAFQLLTAPVSAHMISRVAYRRRHVRRDLLLVDELRDGESARQRLPGRRAGRRAAGGLSRADPGRTAGPGRRGTVRTARTDCRSISPASPPAVRTAATATSMSSTAYIGTTAGSGAPPPMPVIGVAPWTCQPSGDRPGTADQPSTAS